TLLPAFAFAEGTEEYKEYSASATTVKVNDKTIDVYDMEKAISMIWQNSPSHSRIARTKSLKMRKIG
ncbi:MAG: hypothetical protein ACOX23_04270, partial [Peptococcia bacterium]